MTKEEFEAIVQPLWLLDDPIRTFQITAITNNFKKHQEQVKAGVTSEGEKVLVDTEIPNGLGGFIQI